MPAKGYRRLSLRFRIRPLRFYLPEFWARGFSRASSLIARLRRAKSEDRLDRELDRLLKADMLVIDELGFLPLDPDGAKLLFQVVSQAYERQTLVITTNVEFSLWGSTFGDDQMAAAVIDRLIHHGRMLRFHGEPWRVAHSLMSGTTD